MTPPTFDRVFEIPVSAFGWAIVEEDQEIIQFAARPLERRRLDCTAQQLLEIGAIARATATGRNPTAKNAMTLNQLSIVSPEFILAPRPHRMYYCRGNG